MELLDKLQKRLQRLCDKSSVKSRLISVVQSKSFDDEMKAIRTFREALASILHVESLNTLMINKQRDDQKWIFDWLSSPNITRNHDIARGKRHQGTGSWFINSAEFQAWKTPHTPFTDGSAHQWSMIWLHGIPGCGKTILASTIIQTMSEYCAAHQERGLAYFYFSFSAQDGSSSTEAMLQTLVWQLGARNQAAYDVLWKARDNARTMGLTPNADVLREVLCEMMQKFTETYVILDALDECTHVEGNNIKLLKTLHEVVLRTRAPNWPNSSTVRILMTSRKELDIEKYLLSIPIPDSGIIALRGGEVDPDIRDFIRTNLLTDKYFSRLQPHPHDTPQKKEEKKELRLLIENKMMEKANGMFRWADCQLISLRTCSSSRDIKQALEALPRDLDSTYQRVLANTLPGKEQAVLTLLRWLSFPGRYLTVQEVAEAMVIDVDTDQVDGTARYFDSHEIIDLCPGLIDTIVTTEKNNDNMGKATEIEVIRLAHYSVKEYLMSGRGVERYYIDEQITSTYLARACLTYLRYLELETESWRTERVPPLADYVAQYWPTYARIGDHGGHEKEPTVAQGTLTRQIHRLFTTPRALAMWTGLFDPDIRKPRPESSATDTFPSPLYYASLCGLMRYARYLLDHCGAEDDVSKDSGQFGSPLRAAARYGFARVVSMLLDAGADITKISGEVTETTMKLAVSAGHKEVIQLLVNKQLAIGRAESYLDEVHSAVGEGYLDITKLLLDSSNTDINAHVGFTGRLLQRAASTGQHEIVCLLLLYGANVDTEDGWYGTALRSAALEGHETVVRVLLDKEANMYLRGNSPGTPLAVAIDFQRRGVARMILEHGHDVNHNEGAYGTVLQSAASDGDREAVELLLQWKADVNIEGGIFHTALQAAAHAGDAQIVKTLLDRGALPNTSPGVYGTALNAAVSIQNYDIVELLINAGADVNASGGARKCPLEIAQAGGSRQIEQLLRNAGA
ncbi:ankyrin repeat-containing domain protein, partial [Triangularia verruculosa]